MNSWVRTTGTIIRETEKGVCVETTSADTKGTWFPKSFQRITVVGDAKNLRYANVIVVPNNVVREKGLENLVIRRRPNWRVYAHEWVRPPYMGE